MNISNKFLIELKDVESKFAEAIIQEFKNVVSYSKKRTILGIEDHDTFIILSAYLYKINIEFYIQCVAKK